MGTKQSQSTWVYCFMCYSGLVGKSPGYYYRWLFNKMMIMVNNFKVKLKQSYMIQVKMLLDYGFRAETIKTSLNRPN